eukprot:CAMPEP_0172538188 /NCGR_PEP_ID=MMETSP1067-20121228/9636_1 /TAXON_ID=265564 ORGANISM="Thalassiosira punctigera, Strain Tpunct2005C2" /NCGR_SAMPLE_ID=MMETSP1067 /ASSEMBLY_ACC=CAM_ASM_000444 /LENGTH=373 /DNA_ID=CAMNT_0013323641 /DNA_START=10 /DNA_END=1131 /DNA_ORIENTATION=+
MTIGGVAAFLVASAMCGAAAAVPASSPSAGGFGHSGHSNDRQRRRPKHEHEECPKERCLSPETGLCEDEVQCFADPCDRDPCEDGLVCEPNNCGGCRFVCSQPQQATAEFWDVEAAIFDVSNSNEPGACDAEDERACPDGSFCRRDPGACDAPTGTCAKRGGACIEIYEPVCGCDGNTYDNSCFANRAGASVSSRGGCVREDLEAEEGMTAADLEPATLGGPTSLMCAVGPGADDLGVSCPAEFFCRLRIGNCDDGTRVRYGECAMISEVCPKHYEPVCGCDGNTYSNECVAAIDSVSISYLGECKKRDPVPAAGGSDKQPVVQLEEPGDPCAGMGRNMCKRDRRCRFKRRKGGCSVRKRARNKSKPGRRGDN